MTGNLALDGVDEGQRATATFAAAAVHALAREEALGRRPKRLLETDLATWKRFRGRLGPAGLLELLLEDAAVTQPSAFCVPAELGREPLAHLPEGLVGDWLAALATLELDEPGPAYVTAQAKRLGLPTRMAKATLHKLKPHHSALELPGTGGQLAHHVVTSQADVFLQDVFTVACADWREAMLAALVAVEVGLSGPAPAVRDPQLSIGRSRGEVFDYVMGLSTDKGGAFDEATLAEWFPKATIVLV